MHRSSSPCARLRCASEFLIRSLTKRNNCALHCTATLVRAHNDVTSVFWTSQCVHSNRYLHLQTVDAPIYFAVPALGDALRWFCTILVGSAPFGQKHVCVLAVTCIGYSAPSRTSPALADRAADDTSTGNSAAVMRSCARTDKAVDVVVVVDRPCRQRTCSSTSMLCATGVQNMLVTNRRM